MSEFPKRRLRDRTSPNATLISEGCSISGVISGDGDFLINGEIEGNCDIAGTVTLSASGRWTGTIKAGNLIVAGTVDGDIIAAGRIEIVNTARISGTITGGEIAVAEGAVVDGTMKTTSEDEPLSFTEKRDA